MKLKSLIYIFILLSSLVGPLTFAALGEKDTDRRGKARICTLNEGGISEMPLMLALTGESAVDSAWHEFDPKKTPKLEPSLHIKFPYGEPETDTSVNPPLSYKRIGQRRSYSSSFLTCHIFKITDRPNLSHLKKASFQKIHLSFLEEGGVVYSASEGDEQRKRLFINLRGDGGSSSDFRLVCHGSGGNPAIVAETTLIDLKVQDIPQELRRIIQIPCENLNIEVNQAPDELIEEPASQG
ncbi:MAG: hypothetical protein AAF203_10880 [Pseudomonadota bacterium]